MNRLVLVASAAALCIAACERVRVPPTNEAAPSPTPELNLLHERSEPQDPMERARRALDDLETTMAALPTEAQARLEARFARVREDASRVLARLDPSRAEPRPDARRLQLELRAVPLSLSLLLTDVGLDLHKKQLPEETGHELSHAAERARRAWLDLARELQAHEA